MQLILNQLLKSSFYLRSWSNGHKRNFTIGDKERLHEISNVDDGEGK